MTLRKYKKLLMSHGIDRDQAEDDRKVATKWRRIAAKNGLGPEHALPKSLELGEIVAFRKKRGTTSRRGRIKYMKELLKNVVVV